MPLGPCGVANCPNSRADATYCHAHRWQLRKYGDVQADRPLRQVRRYATGVTCSVDSCPERPSSQDMCKFHYQRWRVQGDPEVATIIVGDIERRFWSKVDLYGPPPTERPDLGPCWLWLGSLDRGGYGWFKAEGRMQKAHRWGYQRFVGEIPRDLQVDHLCRVRHCVNFEDHLEAVTPLVNSNRSLGPGSQVFCKHGHEFTPENTYRRPEGGRKCRACTTRAQREYKARKRAATT